VEDTGVDRKIIRTTELRGTPIGGGNVDWIQETHDMIPLRG
jgi:hypothetical protein